MRKLDYAEDHCKAWQRREVMNISRKKERRMEKKRGTRINRIGGHRWWEVLTCDLGRDEAKYNVIQYTLEQNQNTVKFLTIF